MLVNLSGEILRLRMATVKFWEKIQSKLENILAYEALRQDISMDLPLQLNKKFNNISCKSGKSLLVELIFGVSKRAEGRQKPRRLLLMIQKALLLVSLSTDTHQILYNSAQLFQICFP